MIVPREKQMILNYLHEHKGKSTTLQIRNDLKLHNDVVMECVLQLLNEKKLEIVVTRNG